jgi:hypothetical protein
MDTGATIIVLGLAALIVLPILLNILFKTKKNKKLLSDLLTLAEKEKLTISQKEVWNKCYAIGIDINSKKIFYVHKLKDEVQESLIDLSEVKECRIVDTDKTLKNQDGNSNHSDRLELVFSFHKPGIREKRLEFYDNHQFKPTNDDFHQIKNWLQIVQSNLKINND